ncbi:MAG: ATP-binding protein [Lachnospiraceae bacterium]|nr:ATP-binding protein [Lachnospiraceae bacterium]
MLPEISLNILDIAQNSIVADASLITITVDEATEGHLLRTEIADDGKGMSEETLASVVDPFFTTRKTRNVGLGIPFLKQEAESTGGVFRMESEPGKGTVVTAIFCTDHIDCMPLGDVNATIHALITMNPQIDFCYRRIVNDRSFELNTREMRQILGDIPFDTPDVSLFLKEYLESNEAELEHDRATKVEE